MALQVARLVSSCRAALRQLGTLTGLYVRARVHRLFCSPHFVSLSFFKFFPCEHTCACAVFSPAWRSIPSGVLVAFEKPNSKSIYILHQLVTQALLDGTLARSCALGRKAAPPAPPTQVRVLRAALATPSSPLVHRRGAMCRAMQALGTARRLAARCTRCRAKSCTGERALLRLRLPRPVDLHGVPVGVGESHLAGL
jgi:hypothetical protein